MRRRGNKIREKEGGNKWGTKVQSVLSFSVTVNVLE
jgi:hypothetical protein